MILPLPNFNVKFIIVIAVMDIRYVGYGQIPYPILGKSSLDMLFLNVHFL